MVRGLDPLHPSTAEAAAAAELIRRAHAQGRSVRFWGTLDTPRQWQVGCDTGFRVVAGSLRQ